MRVTVSYDSWNQMQECMRKLGEKNAAFASGIAQAANSSAETLTASEVLGKLSNDTVQVLKSLKANPANFESEDWTTLLVGLKNAGAISESDYVRIPQGDLMPIPVLPGGVTHYAPGERPIEEMLKGICDWPGNPLEKLDTLALYTRKCVGILNLSSDTKGNPGSLYSASFTEYEASYMRVSKAIKDLLAKL